VRERKREAVLGEGAADGRVPLGMARRWLRPRARRARRTWGGAVGPPRHQFGPRRGGEAGRAAAGSRLGRG
jgi:hypothetical protein